jgi:error-prone DNA polymerase
VVVLPVDVMKSDWDCGLEGSHVRLGLRMVSGLSESAAQRVVAARLIAPFTSTEDLASRVELGARDLKALADADALFHF